jgi:RsiW-degrading membrane proteinase PrsW (M82 family)
VALLGISYVAGFVAGYLCLQAFELLNRMGLRDDPTDAPGFLLYCILAVGLLEEIAKLVPFVLLCMWLPNFDEPVDGVIYASVVALGFASYENFMYMEFLEGPAMFGRAFASPLTHAMFASIWGYAAGRARHEGRSVAVWIAVGLAIAAVLHGLYDFVIVGAPAYYRPLSAAIILAIWIWRMRAIRDLHAEDNR